METVKELEGDRGWQRYRQTKKRRQAGRKTDLQTDGDRQMEIDNRRQTEGDSRTDIAVQCFGLASVKTYAR